RQHDERDEAGLVGAERLLHQPRSNRWLLRIVLSEVADDDVGVEADHGIRPIFSMVLFMSSMVTGFLGRPTMPLSDRMSRVAATTRKPCSDSTNSSRSPASTPNRSRTLFGRVTCPLLVTVADAMAHSLLSGKEYTTAGADPARTGT